MTRMQRIVAKTRELLHIEQEPAKPEPAKIVIKAYEPIRKAPAKPLPGKHPEAPKAPPAAVHHEGIDYSAGNGVTAAEIKRGGKHFVCRYISSGNVSAKDRNPKDINRAELVNLTKAGLSVALVWETTAQRMLEGEAAGSYDAKKANAQVISLGLPGLPIYFACDFDATEAQQREINAYLSGVATVIGRKRTGIYAGFWPLKRAFDAGRVAYGWQTYAWSGGFVDSRAQLYQHRNGEKLGPAEVDEDTSRAVDYGQTPRP